MGLIPRSDKMSPRIKRQGSYKPTRPQPHKMTLNDKTKTRKEENRLSASRPNMELKCYALIRAYHPNAIMLCMCACIKMQDVSPIYNY